MNELIIQTHRFDNAKNKLKEYSEKIPTSVALQMVATNGGLFNLFKHNVTGEQLNNLTTQIQSYLIDINNQLIESIKEFGEVYNALESLDKDYLQSIIISIKAAEEASRQAKIAQKDIKKMIEVQNQTINNLKQFKEKIDKFEHLENIDDIWNDYQIFKEDMISFNAKIENNVKSIETQIQAINDLKQFKEQIVKYEHLKNIDEIWSDSQTFKKDIKLVNVIVKNIVESIEEQTQDINAIKQFKEQIDKYEHLKNIDEIWNDCQIFKEDTRSINAKIENQKEEIDSETKVQISSIRNMIDEDKMKYEERNKILIKKLKITYILAGSSVGATLLNFVLHILGVI